MKRFYLLFVLIIFIAGFYSCQKVNDNETPENNNEEPESEYYGTPFEGVPKIQDVIMYEVNLRAFSSAGNIQGVINKLDHIEALGINVIWLMPIYPIGQINSVNSPYSVKNYKAVSSEYGTLNDLRN